MKSGGKSWNGSGRHKQGVPSRFKCLYCNREYKMEWTRNNHQKICEERK